MDPARQRAAVARRRAVIDGMRVMSLESTGRRLRVRSAWLVSIAVGHLDAVDAAGEALGIEGEVDEVVAVVDGERELVEGGAPMKPEISTPVSRPRRLVSIAMRPLLGAARPPK
jgi:hypothetical protein